jgi:hypothetical protein
MMKNKTVKNALLGIALALVAAYFYPIVLFTLLDGSVGFEVLFSLLPLYGVFYTSWIVIPLGAALGMLIPKIAYGKNRWVAALQGAGFGAIGGLASVLCFTSFVSFDTSIFWISVPAYCAVWVGAYACYRAKGQSLYR